MNYMKPTLSLLDVAGNSNIPTNCDSGTVDGKVVLETLKDFGIDPNKVFTDADGCQEPFEFEGWCKFTGAVQVFFS